MPPRKIRWGILGTGNAAREFAQGLRFVEGAELAAIGSRSAERAAVLARVCGAPRACGSYEELAADPAIDVVYVGTPNSLHTSHSLLALRAGKAVLCEKPFAMSERQAQEVIAFARQRSLFCMEAMWMHFLPGMQSAMELVRAGAIGEPRMLMADFGTPAGFDREDRLYSAALGGGALMDRGVYPLALAWRLFGRPETVDATASLAPTGVDEQCAATLRYSGGQIAILSASLTGYSANEAVIAGTTGRITIHEPLCRPDRLTISSAPASTPILHATAWPGIRARLRSSRWARGLRRLLPRRERTVHSAYEGNGYNYEAAEVVRCLRAGSLESGVWSLNHTAGVMRTLDLIRSRWTA